jgi:uncharacterized tellurite resistance protein B-like protein
MSYDLEQLKLAFAYSIVEEIVDADQNVNDAERRYLSEVFPAITLESCGFVDEDGKLNDDYRAAVARSLEVLSGALTLHQKFELIDLFMGASLADGEFHHEEGNVMIWASRLLGLSTAELDGHLSSLAEVGAIDLPEPEGEEAP